MKIDHYNFNYKFKQQINELGETHDLKETLLNLFVTPLSEYETTSCKNIYQLKDS